MNKDQRKAIYKKAIEQWGEGLQCLMFSEESSELNILLAKHLRGKNPPRIKIAEEIADCLVILEQLEFMFDVEKEVNDIKVQKLDRVLKMAIDSESRQDVKP